MRKVVTNAGHFHLIDIIYHRIEHPRSYLSTYLIWYITKFNKNKIRFICLLLFKLKPLYQKNFNFNLFLLNLQQKYKTKNTVCTKNIMLSFNRLRLINTYTYYLKSMYKQKKAIDIFYLNF